MGLTYYEGTVISVNSNDDEVTRNGLGSLINIKCNYETLESL